jgi:hypothetical protein
MNFDVWQMIDPIKVGVGLSGTIASHKTLTQVVGMTMILDDFFIITLNLKKNHL